MAVLPTLRSLGIPDRLSAQIAGEAMFNDGIAIVMFLSLMALAGGDGNMGAADVLLLFLRETVGGVVFGVLLGWLGYLLMKSVDNYQLEILITLAMVSGGYSLATVLEISGPLAMVLAGLLIGGRGRKFAMSDRTRENLDRFWELVEEMLNAILFTLIGLEILVIVAQRLTLTHLAIGLLAIPLVLLARYLSDGFTAECIAPAQQIRFPFCADHDLERLAGRHRRSLWRSPCPMCRSGACSCLRPMSWSFSPSWCRERTLKYLVSRHQPAKP